MNSTHLESTSRKNARLMPVEPQVKSSKTREMSNAGVSAKSKTGKSADPACYDAHVRKQKGPNMKITPKMKQALRDYADGYDQPEFGDYYESGALAFRNRDRVIEALMRRGLIDKDQIITQAGRDVLEGRLVDTSAMTETQFERFAR